jgi:hypothetical protein
VLITDEHKRKRLLDDGDTQGGSSLAVLQNWQEWWQVWGPKLAAEYGRQPWVLFVMDGIEKQVKLTMAISRIIRQKPDELGQWDQMEWLNISELTSEALVWFETNQPRYDDLPEVAQFLVRVQHGFFRGLKRLGREVREIQEYGHNTITVETDELTGTHIEVG